jgi:hypothetical protein
VCRCCKAKPEPPPPPPRDGPAWLIGIVLGLIGLVEVLRLIFDYVTR